MAMSGRSWPLVPWPIRLPPRSGMAWRLQRGPDMSEEKQSAIDTRSWPFDTVLVANRGEIAVRVIRSVQALGLKAVVVYHAADANTLAVRLADVAHEIAGETPVAAYLDGAQILVAAKQTGAGAIHPGYGFLSENSSFC